MFPKLPHHGGHGLDAAGGDGDLLVSIIGIGNPDAARRRPQVTVQIVDGDDAQIDRSGLRDGGCRTQAEYQQGREEEVNKETFHAVMLVGPCNDFTKRDVREVMDQTAFFLTVVKDLLPPPCGVEDERSSLLGAERRVAAGTECLTTPTPNPSPQGEGNHITHTFLRAKNALNAAIASLERMRSPNKWLS